jgi:hypothetical protein
MDNDTLAAALGEIRKTFNRPVPGEQNEAVQRLLLAVDLVGGTHYRTTVFGPASDEDNPSACPHDLESDHDEHFEGDDGNWYCTSRPVGSQCRCGEEWPCGEYAAVLGALTGRGTTTVMAALTREEKPGGQ